MSSSIFLSLENSHLLPNVPKYILGTVMYSPKAKVLTSYTSVACSSTLLIQIWPDFMKRLTLEHFGLS